MDPSWGSMYIHIYIIYITTSHNHALKGTNQQKTTSQTSDSEKKTPSIKVGSSLIMSPPPTRAWARAMEVKCVWRSPKCDSRPADSIDPWNTHSPLIAIADEMVYQKIFFSCMVGDVKIMGIFVDDVYIHGNHGILLVYKWDLLRNPYRAIHTRPCQNTGSPWTFRG